MTIAQMPEVNAPEPPARESTSGASGSRRSLAQFGSRIGQAWRWLKWPVGLGILAWLYYSNKTEIRAIAAAPKFWSFAGMAFALIGGSSLITFFRWYLLVRAQDFPFRLRDAVRYGFVGLVANYIAPGAVGGDLFKAFLLARDQESRRWVAGATVLLDRILGLLALFVVGSLATMLPHDVPFNPQLQMATVLLWCGSLGGLVGVGLMLLPATTRWSWVNRLPGLPWIGRVVGEIIQGVKLYQSRPRAVLCALGLSVIGHAGLITGFYFCALWMRQPWVPSLTAHFYFMPIAETFSVLIPTPGGVGALEEAISWFYLQLKPNGIAAAQAQGAGAVAAIAFRVVAVTVAAIGGGYYFASRREISAAMEEASHAAEPAT